MLTVEMTREEINTFIFILKAKELDLDLWSTLRGEFVVAKHKKRDGRTDILLIMDENRNFYYTRDDGLIWRMI